MFTNKIVRALPLRSLATPNARLSTASPRIVAKQKKFQEDIEKPVYLAGGAGDKILFTTTCALVTIGVAACLKLFYTMANPKQE